jgi:hypothetical protein
MSSVTEEYQDGENSYCDFFRLVPFLQLAIQLNLLKLLRPAVLISLCDMPSQVIAAKTIPCFHEANAGAWLFSSPTTSLLKIVVIIFFSIRL